MRMRTVRLAGRVVPAVGLAMVLGILAVPIGRAEAKNAAGAMQTKAHPAKKPKKNRIHRCNLNMATEAQLATVKGITPDLAKKITAGRIYRSVDELAKIGMTKPAIDTARPFLTVGGLNGRWRRPVYRLAPGEKVNLNTAPLKVLIALPRIGPARAEAIVKGCPYGRIEDIMKIRGIKKRTFAKLRNTIVVR